MTVTVQHIGTMNLKTGMTVKPLKGDRTTKNTLHINLKVNLGYIYNETQGTSLLICY